MDCYGRSNEVLEKFIDIQVSTAQVYLVTDCYGQASAEVVNESRTLEPVKKDEVLYVEVDGSMVLTREDGWREVKVGRMFNSGSCIDPNGKSSWIRHSQYVAHLGSSQVFTSQMDELIESYGRLGNRLIFIADGGTWIKNWVEDSFPQAVSILDYYHACEHLSDFADSIFKDEAQKEKWVGAQKELLLESKVEEVIENIRSQGAQNEVANALINYYNNNASRMDYKLYKTIGAGIFGSGAIESAHRTVVQRRMKQSGQRWSVQGARNMLNLRVLRMNGQWSKIVEIIKKAA